MTQSDAATGILTPLAVQILNVGAGRAYGRLVVDGPGDADAKQVLAGVRPSQLVAAPVADEEAAEAMLAGLWLWHDWLDESHAISQGLASPTGSFWHAFLQ